MNIDPSLVVTLILGLLGGGGFSSLIRLWWERRDGTEDRKVAEVNRISEMFERERDRANILERDKRRIAEHASDLRRFVIEHCGIPASELPPWPEKTSSSTFANRRNQ